MRRSRNGNRKPVRRTAGGAAAAAVAATATTLYQKVGAELWEDGRNNSSSWHPSSPRTANAWRGLSNELSNESSKQGRGWTAAEAGAVVDAWEESFSRIDMQDMDQSNTWLDMWPVTREMEIKCTLKVDLHQDGIGSEVLRWLFGVILAEGLGCAIVTPDLTPPPLEDPHADDWKTLAHFHENVEKGGVWRNGTLYCHRTVTENDTRSEDTSFENLSRSYRCVIEDWEQFFNLQEYTAESTAASAWTTIIPSPKGSAHVDNWLPVYRERYSVLLLLVSSVVVPTIVVQGRTWRKGDDPTASIPSAVRTAINRIREAFHRFPRPGYAETPDCGFAPNQLNVAVHLRMGDLQGRKTDDHGATAEGYDLHVHSLVERISTVVAQIGYSPPVFHIFSESRSPCPHPESRVFGEFPHLHISTEQIQACRQLVSTPSEHCPEREMGGVCGFDGLRSFTAELDGVTARTPTSPTTSSSSQSKFMLHMNGHEGETLRCMANADIVVSSNSCFGQLATLLNNGLKIFCTTCGRTTARKIYGKILTFLALAEGGRFWFPVAGREREPVLSTVLLKDQLAALCAMRNVTPLKKNDQGGGG